MNNSSTANYWSKETNLEKWAKTVWGITEQKLSAQHKTHHIHKKFKCNMEPQSNEE